MADTPATATPTTPTTATTTPKRIQVSFRFTRDTDNVVLNRGNAVDKGLDGNVHFPNLPVSLADLRANKATYSDLITASLDGSKKAIAARKKQRHIIIGQLRQLASYVEVASNGDMAVFLSSGFEAVPPRGGTQPLAQPKIVKVAHRNSGQVAVTFTAVRKARHYDMHYSPWANGQPGSGTTVTLAKARPAPVISGLTPGTVYAFQVRAYGVLGFTEWSDSVTLMCT